MSVQTPGEIHLQQIDAGRDPDWGKLRNYASSTEEWHASSRQTETLDAPVDAADGGT